MVKFSLSFLLFVLFFCSTAPAKAEESDVPRYIQVPVFYATDRAWQDGTFSGQRKYPLNCLHDMYYGVAYVTVPNDKKLVKDANFQRLGWKVAEKPAKAIWPKDHIDAENLEDEKKLFFDRFAGQMEHSGQSQACLFVHGAADPFDDAALDAASLQYYMQQPTILYSWPSNGKLKDYRIDEGNVEWSQEHFDTFCEDLQSFKVQHPLSVTLVCHSAGNRLVVRAVRILRKTDYLSDVALISPDIDAETFKHYVMGYRGAERPRCRLYVSDHDKVLAYTQLVYGGYYRLGEGVGSVMSMISPPAAAGGGPLQKLRGAAAIAGQNGPRPRQRPHGPGAPLEKIDFTDMDAKWIGHTLPFELVADMTKTGSPPEGYVLVPERIGEGNWATRYARKHNHLPEEPFADGYCKKVVRADKVKQEIKAGALRVETPQ